MYFYWSLINKVKKPIDLFYVTGYNNRSGLLTGVIFFLVFRLINYLFDKKELWSILMNRARRFMW